MKKMFLKDRAALLSRNAGAARNGTGGGAVFSDELTAGLSEPIRKYLKVCGYMGTPVPVNADVVWAESSIRLSPEKDWAPLETIQFNSVKPIGRVAYMKFLSMPVAARDLYRDGYGEMNGKLFRVIPVVYDDSPEVAQSALITAFCEFMFIPGYVLLESVSWEQIDERVVRGTLCDNGITVTGEFHFDDEGYFTRFETLDRYYTTGKRTYRKVRFSATVASYKTQGAIRIGENVQITWHLPDGDLEYYKGVIDRVEFNVGGG
ncbi:MAG: hypothetical protein EA383_04500 [Spirochaetaceae bacterium]|nr:MAG: hypothetical protein EA383_04500 [Spirochaetaceae bacterium]